MRTFDLHHLGNRKAMQCFALVTGFLRTVMDCLEPLTDPKIEGKTRAQALAAAKEAVVEILGRCSDVVRLMREELDPLIEVDGR